MPDETVPTPPSPLDVLDSRLAFLRAELSSLDELVAAPAFDDKNQNARLTFCVRMAELALDELELRVFGSSASRR
jgi:hypothetical protein